MPKSYDANKCDLSGTLRLPYPYPTSNRQGRYNASYALTEPLTAIRCGEYDKKLIYRKLSAADKSMGFGRWIVNLKNAHSIQLLE